MLYRGHYRVESARLPGWDYPSAGHYFVTVMTHGNTHLFGRVVRGRMVVNDFGAIVWDEWWRSFRLREELVPDRVAVMPNRLHGIVHIVGVRGAGRGPTVVVPRGRADVHTRVETHGRESLPVPPVGPPWRPSTGVAYRAPRSVSSMIAGCKSAVTARINDTRNTPGATVWQPRFYDHIIRDSRELFLIRRYIRDNPRRWATDRREPLPGPAPEPER